LNPSTAGAPDLPGLELYLQSQTSNGEATFWLASKDAQRLLVIATPPGDPMLDRFSGERSLRDGQALYVGPADHANASALRAILPWLRPRMLGTRTTAGMGDRLGAATPGRVRALKGVVREFEGRSLAPIRTAVDPGDVASRPDSL
jgi:hypothetical protein